MELEKSELEQVLNETMKSLQTEAESREKSFKDKIENNGLEKELEKFFPHEPLDLSKLSESMNLSLSFTEFNSTIENFNALQAEIQNLEIDLNKPINVIPLNKLDTVLDTSIFEPQHEVDLNLDELENFKSLINRTLIDLAETKQDQTDLINQTNTVAKLRKRSWFSRREIIPNFWTPMCNLTFDEKYWPLMTQDDLVFLRHFSSVTN